MLSRNRDERLRRVFARIYTGFALTFVAWAIVDVLDPVAGFQKIPAAVCHVDAPLASIAALPEASGIAASRRNPGALWAHNDSGDPVLVALDSRGVVTNRVRVRGVAMQDWEDVAVGPCAGGSCIYIADIGDNQARRSAIMIYRVPEPAPTDTETVAATMFPASYPDGPQDAETLIVTADARMFIVTKGDKRGIAVYRFPGEPRDGATVQLQRVGALTRRAVDEDQRITGGAASPDGRWIVLRTHARLMFYLAAEFTKGTFREASRADVRAIRERQGEGVAFGPADELFLVGEGGGDKRPGTLARLICQLPQ
jgi:hypothetical protein